MFIKEVELNNFRIYKGVNKIELYPDKDKNIIIISGKNGFGKTTFLMSLVWCLYGKQMENVDELYLKEIADKGGYGKYIGNSLNRLAKVEGETKFSASITFSDIDIAGISCSNIKITRSYDTVTSTSDQVEILIDGFKNELFQDLTTDGKQDGEEIFIRDFILPIEIAKFFFFDAEKIVSLAVANSTEHRKLLSKAYTEVLGIKKYEDLRDTYENLQDDYRKKSAKPKEKQELSQVKADIEKTKLEIEFIEEQVQLLSDEKMEKNSESQDIQRKLIQEGNLMTLEQLNNLREEKNTLELKIEELQLHLKELFDLTPLALAGNALMEVSSQLENEKIVKTNQFKQNDVNEKVANVLDDLEQEKNKLETVIPFDIRSFYENQIQRLIKKHFFSDMIDIPNNLQTLHDFSDSSTNELNQIINNIKHSFKEQFTRLNDEYSRSKGQIDSIRRKIRNAEKNAEDEYVSELRDKKEVFDKRIISIENEIGDFKEKIGALKNNIKMFRQRQKELRKKIDASRLYSKKDKVIQELIKELKSFIKSLKEEKKKSLEENMLNQLNTLMHKKGFITRVVVDINQHGDDVDINLFNARKEKIDKGSLSMGERQMYASALLKALVDESDIEFPVFIDSPMQKFDKDHAENIINEFYPNVSKQVVLFPLIHKELTTEEFQLLKPMISKSYLIHNTSIDSSEFIKVKPKNLIKKYDELYAN